MREIIDDGDGWRALGIHKLTNKQPEQPYYSHKSDYNDSSDIHRYRILLADLVGLEAVLPYLQVSGN
jgi:hypothetical protein